MAGREAKPAGGEATRVNVRTATTADGDRIATVARDSLGASYGEFVEAEAIDRLVEELYAGDGLAALLRDRTVEFLVAEDDGTVVGFAHGAVVTERPLAAELYWLHVAPDRRGERISSRLVGRIQDRFRDRGARVIRGMVLAGNEAGAEFYAAHGFEQVDSRAVDVGGESHEELVFEKPIGDAPAEGIVEAIAGPEGAELYVNYGESERGLKAPLFVVYGDADLTSRYGFVCGNCESLDVTMDSMGRIRCEACGNERKAARWDAVYL